MAIAPTLREGPGDGGGPVDRTVDDGVVHPLPEEDPAPVDHHPADEAVVEVIPVVLGFEDTQRRPERGGESCPQLGHGQVEVVGEEDAGDRGERRHHRQPGHVVEVSVTQAEDRLHDLRDLDEAAHCRADREQDEGREHDPGRFVDVVLGFVSAAEAPEECEEEQPRHVERRQQRSE
jgi:hypothetical protein